MSAAAGTLTGKVALVTGASRGIGAATAVALAQAGAHVVIVARTQGGLEETDDAVRAAGGAATLVPLDLMRPDSIDMLGPSLLERFGRLDILVSNAGVLGVLTPVAHILPKDWEEVIGVNVTAAQRLIGTCAPLLVAAEAGRAVFVTSAAASKPRAYWAQYGATKAALEYLVLAWAEETRTTRLRINLLDPGPVRTAMRARAFPGEDPATLRPAEEIAPHILALCDPASERHGEIVKTR